MHDCLNYLKQNIERLCYSYLNLCINACIPSNLILNTKSFNLTIDHQYTDKVGNTFIIQFNIQKNRQPVQAKQLLFVTLN